LKLFQSIASFKSSKSTVVTIGTFDGVHLGHQKILGQIITEAKESNLESLVLTFFPHPRTVLQEGSEMKQLSTIEEKIQLLSNIGIDNLIIHPFDKTFSRLTAEEFVEQVLVNTFHIKKIIIGYDHRFGRNRTATIDDLISFGLKYNFEVIQISAKEINEVSISSTKIRTALEDGNITLANNFLGYNYSLTGKVVKGKQLGRTIGFPTANLVLEEDYKLIPKNGVYIVESFMDDKKVMGMMNIGTRPTVDGTTQTIEIHFLNLDKNLYDNILTIFILKPIREEVKFESLDALKIQLAKDKKTTEDYFHLL